MNHLDLTPSMLNPMDVKYRVFAPAMVTAGKYNPTPNRYVLDAGSLFQPNIAQSAGNAVNKAAGLEREVIIFGATWAKGFNGLKKERKNTIWEFVKEANKEGLSLRQSELAARGLI